MESDKTFSKTIPPPVLGWSTVQPISQMDPFYAVDIENYFPQNGTVDLRKGKEIFADVASSGTSIISLATYYYQGSYIFLASSTTVASAPYTVKLWNITAGGAGTEIGKDVGATTPVSPFIYFQQYKDNIFFNTGTATGKLYYWDGTGDYLERNYYDGSGPMTIYKGRIYIAQVDEAALNYSGFEDNTFIDTTTENYDVSYLLKEGGNIAFLGTVTRAKDYSEDELFCIISDLGEVLVFQGDSPSDTNWYLIGHYYLPKPLGPRAYFYIGHDLHIITIQGVIPLSGVMSGAKTGAGYLTITEQIDNYFRDNYATQLNDNLAWVGLNYPKGGFALVNAPQDGVTINALFFGVDNRQLIVNTNSQAWTKFTGQDAYCWALFNNDLYYGTSSGEVYKADTGYVDKDSAGATVSRATKLRFAFNYLDKPEQTKILTECVPIVYESENLSLTLNADVDYSDNTATSANTTTGDTSYKLYATTRCGLKADPGKAVSIRMDGTVSTKRRSIQAVEIFWKEGGNR